MFKCWHFIDKYHYICNFLILSLQYDLTSSSRSRLSGTQQIVASARHTWGKHAASATPTWCSGTKSTLVLDVNFSPLIWSQFLSAPFNDTKDCVLFPLVRATGVSLSHVSEPSSSDFRELSLREALRFLIPFDRVVVKRCWAEVWCGVVREVLDSKEGSSNWRVWMNDEQSLTSTSTPPNWNKTWNIYLISSWQKTKESTLVSYYC